jgi:hypothetical protein
VAELSTVCASNVDSRNMEGVYLAGGAKAINVKTGSKVRVLCESDGFGAAHYKFLS